MHAYMFVFVAFAIKVESNNVVNSHSITRRDLVNKQLHLMKQIDCDALHH